jgi:hypothetical protein
VHKLESEVEKSSSNRVYTSNEAPINGAMYVSPVVLSNCSDVALAATFTKNLFFVIVRANVIRVR